MIINNKSVLAWHKIKWAKINQFISEIQKEMVVSYRKGDLTRVYKLQFKLLKSHQAKVYAIRQISSNKGCRTPGMDGFTLKGTRSKINYFSCEEYYRKLENIKQVE
jgi:RNA-directed DNA polymerase